MKHQQNLVAAFDVASPDPLERVRQALDRLGLPWKTTARGLRSCCPVHETAASDPSCDFDLGRDGRVLVTCRSASCSFESIVEALGVDARDLFADTSTSSKNATTRTARSKAPVRPPWRLGTLADAAKKFEAQHKGTSSMPYHYHDEDGQEVLVVMRVKTPDGKKCPVAHLGAGGVWFAGFGPYESRPRPLYGAHTLKANPDALVVIVEGEKCCDALQRLDGLRAHFAATTTINGAGKAKYSDLSPLRGRRVVVLPDNDPQGRDHARDVAKRALAAGADSVKIVELPNLGPSEDCVEWIAARDLEGRGPLAMLQELFDLIENAPLFELEPQQDGQKESQEPAPRSLFHCIGFDEVCALPPVSWLVEGIVAASGVTVLAASPKTGKSFCAIDLMLSMVHGRQHWLGRTLRQGEQPHGVLYAPLEGRAGISSRFRAWRAAHPAEKRIGRIDMLVRHEIAGAVLGAEGVAMTIAWVREKVVEFREAGTPLSIFVLDTLGQATEGDENDAATTGAAMRACATLASELNVAVLVIHHIRKGANGSSGKGRELTLDDVRGSGAIVGAVDGILGLSKTKEEGLIVLTDLGQRDGAGFAPIGIELRGVATGAVREDGSAETSAYIVRSELPTPEERERAAQQAAEERERASKQAAEEGYRSKLLQAAARLDEPVSMGQLCAEAAVRRQAGSVVRDLVREGLLVAVPMGRDKNRYATSEVVAAWRSRQGGTTGNHAEPSAEDATFKGSEKASCNMVPAPYYPHGREPCGVVGAGSAGREAGTLPGTTGNHAEPCEPDEPKRSRKKRIARTASAGGEA